MSLSQRGRVGTGGWAWTPDTVMVRAGRPPGLCRNQHCKSWMAGLLAYNVMACGGRAIHDFCRYRHCTAWMVLRPP